VNDCCKQQICYFCKKDLENFHSCPFCRNKDWKYGNKWNLNTFTDFLLYSKDFPKHYEVIKKIVVDSVAELDIWDHISKEMYNSQTLTFNLHLITNLMPNLEKVKFQLNFKLNEFGFLFNDSNHNIVFSHSNSESYFYFWWQRFPFSSIREFCKQKEILSIAETILNEANKNHQPLKLVHSLFDPALTTVEDRNGSKLNLFQLFIIENPQFLFPLTSTTPEFILVNYHIAFAITDFETWVQEFKSSEDFIRIEVKNLIEAEIKEHQNKDGNEIIQKLKKLKLKVLTEKTEKERSEISRRRELEYILAGSITCIMARRVKLQKSTLKLESYNQTKNRLKISQSIFENLFETTLIYLIDRNYIEKLSNGKDEDCYIYVN
jgi:hypothetical protein